jgi:ribosomal protein S18 acetylase RimI-like enzyme
LSRVAAAFSIRAATPADAGAIARVHRESWRTSYSGILPAEIVNVEAGRRTEGEWRRRLAHKRAASETWIAEGPAEGIVGFASCGESRSPTMPGFDAEIYALYVLQAYHRRGVGRALVRECARHFVRNGLFTCYAWVLKANHARLFYEAMGGEEAGTRTERLGLHGYAQVAYGWRDLTALVIDEEAD